MPRKSSRKTLIVAAAPLEHVKRAVAGYDADELVLVGGQTTLDRIDAGRKIPVSGLLSASSPGLVKAMFRYRPARQIVVCGPSFWHDNILLALHTLSALFLIKADLSFFIDGRLVPARDFKETRKALSRIARHNALLEIAAYASLAAACYGAYLLSPWLAAAGAAVLVLLELALRNGARAAVEEYRYGARAPTPVTKTYSARTVSAFHPALGWRMLPNLRLTSSLGLTELGRRHVWSFSSTALGSRSTSAAGNDGKPVILVLGCSLTHGVYLNDEQTYAWKMQEALPDYQVVNLGHNGYSLYQALLLLEKVVETLKPVAVVMGFHTDLCRRNTPDFFSARYSMPAPSCVSLFGKLLRFRTGSYAFFSLRNSVELIKMLERLVNRLRYAVRGGKKVQRKTTEHLLLQMNHTCRKAKAKFLVASLWDTSPFHEFFVKSGLSWCVSGIDLGDAGTDGAPRYTLSKEILDSHPGEEANAVYAEVIALALRDLLAKGRTRPPVETWAKQVRATGHDQDVRHIYQHY